MIGSTISLIFVVYFPLAMENVWVIPLALLVFVIVGWKILLLEPERQYLKNYMHLSVLFPMP